jgi:hypothetical protein
MNSGWRWATKTQYFHKIANHMKNFNIIWELEDSHGTKKKGFDELADLGVAHFKTLFAKNKNEKVGDMLELLAMFLRMVD